jgi:hypothetical protein
VRPHSSIRDTQERKLVWVLGKHDEISKRTRSR